MDLGVLKKQIKENKPEHFYIFTGTEVAVRDTYIQLMSKAFGMKVASADSFTEVFLKSRGNSLIKDSHIYIVREDKEFTSSEKMWGRLNIKDDIIIMYYANIDKRTKFYKHFENRLVHFDRMEDRHLIIHIKKLVDLSEENCKTLIEACDGDWSRIQLEIDKVRCYVIYGEEHDYDMEYDEAFIDLIKDGTIYRQPKDAIFDFVNAVLDRKPLKAYDLLEQSYAVGEANMVLLSVLYTNIRALLQVQTCKHEGVHDTAKTTGLNGWQIKNVMMYVDKYKSGELVKAMKLIRKAEKGIKTGMMEDKDSIYYVLANIL